MQKIIKDLFKSSVVCDGGLIIHVLLHTHDCLSKHSDSILYCKSNIISTMWKWLFITALWSVPRTLFIKDMQLLKSVLRVTQDILICSPASHQLKLA